MPSSNQGGRVAQRPGIPRGFASTDPERQRETADQAGTHVASPQPARTDARQDGKPDHQRGTAREQEQATAARDAGHGGGARDGQRAPGAGSRG